MSILTFLALSVAALVCGYLLDLLIGDPPRWPHLIKVFGSLIAALERVLYRPRQKNKRLAGFCLVLLTLLVCALVPAAVSALAWVIAPWLYFLLETLLCWQLLATRSLGRESSQVMVVLRDRGLVPARKSLAMIVGRDTSELNEEEITRATVETIAENGSDGVIAPLFYLLIGGAALGCLFKAANTMDSMIGYKNQRYQDFGWAAAKLDDILCYLPARLSALLMVAASGLARQNFRNAWSIWHRDRRKHASPNSAQTEAAVAGALGVRLAGPCSYGGIVLQKPYIGDDLRPIEAQDVTRTNRIILLSSLIMLLLAVLLRMTVIAILLLGGIHATL